MQLKKAKHENTLARRLKHFASYSVLIIDEVGFLPINADDSNLFFQLISMRYEKHPTIFTTNKIFKSDLFLSKIKTAKIAFSG